MIEATYRTARRIVVALIGGTVVAAGIALLVLPGPAFVVIPAGLAILGIEFAFARRWLRALRDRSRSLYRELAPREQGERQKEQEEKTTG